jgi:hypothetical protein
LRAPRGVAPALPHALSCGAAATIVLRKPCEKSHFRNSEFQKSACQSARMCYFPRRFSLRSRCRGCDSQH